MAESSHCISRPIFLAACTLAALAIGSMSTFLITHVGRVGHTGMVERVGSLKEDVAEIKADVKTILRNGGHSSP